MPIRKAAPTKAQATNVEKAATPPPASTATSAKGVHLLPLPETILWRFGPGSSPPHNKCSQ